jgi:hypothetical protein
MPIGDVRGYQLVLVEADDLGLLVHDQVYHRPAWVTLASGYAQGDAMSARLTGQGGTVVLERKGAGGACGILPLKTFLLHQMG